MPKRLLSIAALIACVPASAQGVRAYDDSENARMNLDRASAAMARMADAHEKVAWRKPAYYDFAIPASIVFAGLNIGFAIRSLGPTKKPGTPHE